MSTPAGARPRLPVSVPCGTARVPVRPPSGAESRIRWLAPLLLGACQTLAAAEPLQLKMDLQLSGASPSDRGPAHRALAVRLTADQSDGSLRAELSRQEAFGETGQVLGLGMTRDLNPDWLVSVDGTASDASLFLPRWRLEAGLGRKWLQDRSLVSLLSVARSAARDGHRDSVLSLTGQWYARPGLVLQAGLRQTRSEPGPVSARRAFTALDVARGPHALTVSHEWGRESWVLIDPKAANSAQVKTDLFSRWTRWQYAHALTPSWQLTVGQSWYRREGYARHGVEFGSRFPLEP